MSRPAWKAAAPGLPPLELGSARLWLFTDLHLRAEAADEIEGFVRCLQAAPDGLDAVVVMGDLFDAYCGPDQWREAAFLPLAQAFRGLAQRGVRVLLLRGNRDVLLESADGALVGGEVQDALLVQAGTERVLISHGDEYCLADRPYQRLRRWLRRSWLRRCARALPAGWRRRAAAGLRRASAAAVARKPLDTLALVEEAVLVALRRHGAQMALIGHLHVAEERQLAGARLRILPAWAPGTPPLSLTNIEQTLESAGFMPAQGPVPSQPGAKPVVTLDGLAGSGKSTLARKLALALGWAYLDSGAWYRALAWATVQRRRDPADAGLVLATLSEIELRSRPDGTLLLDGRPLQAELRTPEIDAAVVEVAEHVAVRAALTERMRGLRLAEQVHGVVADGRDAGTVIFPDADLKVFVTAGEDVRARRRAGQQAGADAAAVLAALRQRDRRDAARGASAPRLAAGGRQLENDDLTEEQALRQLLDWVAPLLRPCPAKAGAAARAANPGGHPAAPSP